MKKNIVAGNWKMNKTLPEGLALASEVVNMVKDEVRSNVLIILNPPFPLLSGVNNLIKGSGRIFLGGQNCSQHASGAYTGEVSAAMLKSAGCEYVILGHSERREYFKETNELLAKKVDIAFANGLKPIFCCGESLDIRQKGSYVEYVCRQLTEGVFHLPKEQFSQLVIAYEPIWAIGTGVNATALQAQEMHMKIRDHIASKYGKEVAGDMSILYGGSCNPKNAKELFSNPDVDGGLIGGASLKSRDFVDIIKSF
ncbi:MAG TPA: triose-phosphate isomerase [Cyclobacteriaceae bacterium]|nr:triose-phosphate isomerase [Cyclobacteriaceae bacterium]